MSEEHINLTSPGDICARRHILGKMVTVPVPLDIREKLNENNKIPLPPTGNGDFDAVIVTSCTVYDQLYDPYIVECEPYLSISTEDSYIHHPLTSRQEMEDFIAKLRAKADELWPVQEQKQ